MDLAKLSALMGYSLSAPQALPQPEANRRAREQEGSDVEVSASPVVRSSAEPRAEAAGKISFERPIAELMESFAGEHSKKRSRSKRNHVLSDPQKLLLSRDKLDGDRDRVQTAADSGSSSTEP